MIEYVDRLLAHWAQEYSVTDSGVGIGFRPTWSGTALTRVSGDRTKRLTARGTATRPSKARGGVGRVAGRVNQSVERLPPHLEKAIRLHYFEMPGASVVDKSSSLGCSLSTFHRYIHKAHEAISDDLPNSYIGWRVGYQQAPGK